MNLLIQLRSLYCIFAGLQKFKVRQFKPILNCAAEILASLPKLRSISDYSRDTLLHWLSIEERIMLKILHLVRGPR